MSHRRPYKRTYPHDDPRHMATDQRWFARLFDASERVVVYWPYDGESSVSIVGYYDTVSAANTAAAAAVDGQRYPKIAINWWHSTITTYPVDSILHPDARVDYPSWIDATPAY